MPLNKQFQTTFYINLLAAYTVLLLLLVVATTYYAAVFQWWRGGAMSLWDLNKPRIRTIVYVGMIFLVRCWSGAAHALLYE